MDVRPFVLDWEVIDGRPLVPGAQPIRTHPAGLGGICYM
jgi:hypothetical protein